MTRLLEFPLPGRGPIRFRPSIKIRGINLHRINVWRCESHFVGPYKSSFSVRRVLENPRHFRDRMQWFGGEESWVKFMRPRLDFMRFRAGFMHFIFYSTDTGLLNIFIRVAVGRLIGIRALYDRTTLAEFSDIKVFQRRNLPVCFHTW